MSENVVPGTRGTIVPAAQYTDGEYHIAWPGLAATPVEAFNRMWDRGDDANIENPDAMNAMAADSFDVAGGAMTGGLAAGMAGAVPEGAVAANGIGARIRGIPLAVNAMERARASRHWPEWGDQFPERATYFVADTEARHSWKAAVDRALLRNPGMTAKEAEAAAMQAEPDVGQMYQTARRAMLENHKGRPLTKGEEVWESLDRPPGAPDATPQELMDTTVRENFMVFGHPDLQRKKLGNDIYANHSFGSSVPLAFNDYEDQPQNAMARDRR